VGVEVDLDLDLDLDLDSVAASVPMRRVEVGAVGSEVPHVNCRT